MKNPIKPPFSYGFPMVFLCSDPPIKPPSRRRPRCFTNLSICSTFTSFPASEAMKACSLTGRPWRAWENARFTLWWTNILPWKNPPFFMGKLPLFRLGHFQLQTVSSPEGNMVSASGNWDITWFYRNIHHVTTGIHQTVITNNYDFQWADF